MKEVVTEENYKRKSIGRAIVLCWILLAICFVVKLFGGNFFAYIGESEVANYIEERWYLLKPLQCLFYMIQSLLFLPILYNFKHKRFVIISSIVLSIFKNIIRLSNSLMIISFILEFVFLIILPIIICNKPKRVVIVNILLVIFQIISLLTKNISVVSFPSTTIVGYLYMVDYYIMLALTNLYFKYGGIRFMELGFWFLSTDKTQLEAYKKHLETKKDKKIALINKKHDKKVAKVDARIAKAK
jgi:hypothetical protein